MRAATVTFALLLVACGGEPRSAGPPARGHLAVEEPEDHDAPPPTEPEAEPEAPTPEPAAPAEDPFAAPLPTAACPDAARVAIAHANAEGLPTWLERAVAFLSEDGRQLRVAIANHPLELDANGRFAAPSTGEARFEMDATRTRRGRLEPRVLGAPDSRVGGLTHARIVGAASLLTFGHRNVGQVELTEITRDHVCGRLELDDGFGRVRGAFRADVIGPLPP
ncbi:MAG: hypothetical protein H6719_05395 [Sandaracinaceae bacterium]|nr:hypothetical protein [Sandaracinaceae bacterium]